MELRVSAANAARRVGTIVVRCSSFCLNYMQLQLKLLSSVEALKASTDEVVLLEVFAASSKFAALAGNFTHFLLQTLLEVSYTCSYSFLRLTIRCAAWNLRAQMYSICPKGLTFWHQKYTLIFPNPAPPHLHDPNLSVFQRNLKRDL